MSGPTQATRAVVYARAGNSCEICHRTAEHGSLHHRRARGMGGTRSKWVNLPANLLLVCGSGTTGCHGKIESYREASYAAGWLLRWGQDGEHTPFVDRLGTWWRIDNEGGKGVDRRTSLSPGVGSGGGGDADTRTVEAVDDES